MDRNLLNLKLYNLDSVEHQFYRPSNALNIGLRWDKKALCWDYQLQQSDNHLNFEGAYDLFLSITRQTILTEFDNPTVLDIGCGTGIISDSISSIINYSVGLDVSSVMISVARKKNIYNASFFRFNLFNINYFDVNFDLVTSRGILLSHYRRRDARLIIELIFNVLLESGILIIDFLNSNSLCNKNVVGKTLFDTDDISSLLLSIGFNKVSFFGGNDSRVIICVAKK